jgi:hypothetical protein
VNLCGDPPAVTLFVPLATLPSSAFSWCDARRGVQRIAHQDYHGRFD